MAEQILNLFHTETVSRGRHAPQSPWCVFHLFLAEGESQHQALQRQNQVMVPHSGLHQPVAPWFTTLDTTLVLTAPGFSALKVHQRIPES